MNKRLLHFQSQPFFWEDCEDVSFSDIKGSGSLIYFPELDQHKTNWVVNPINCDMPEGPSGLAEALLELLSNSMNFRTRLVLLMSRNASLSKLNNKAKKWQSPIFTNKDIQFP